MLFIKQIEYLTGLLVFDNYFIYPEEYPLWVRRFFLLTLPISWPLILILGLCLIIPSIIHYMAVVIFYGIKNFWS